MGMPKRVREWGVDLLLLVVFSFCLVGPCGLGAAFPFDEDTLLFNVPLRHLLTDPDVGFWNPYLFCGAPLDANPQVQLFYPPNLLYQFCPLPLAYGLLLWFHLAAGALGIAVLLHVLGVGAHGRRTGAIVFLFSTYWQAKMMNAGMLAGSAWAGFALAGFVLALERPSRRSAGFWLAVLSLALSVLAGVPHPPALILLAMLFLAAEVVGRDPGRRWKVALLCVDGAALTAILSAVAWLPALENLPRTHRGPLTEEQAYAGALTLWELPGALLGGLSQPSIARLDPWEGTAAISSMGLILAGLGFAATVIRTAAPRRWAWAAMGLLALALACGPHLPLAGWLRACLPDMDRFNLPNRALLLTVIGLSVYAGFGYETLSRPLSSRHAYRWILAGGGLLLGVVILVTLWPDLLVSLRQTDFTRGMSRTAPPDWLWSLAWNLLWGGLALVVLGFLSAPGPRRAHLMGLAVALLILVPQWGVRTRLYMETVSPDYLEMPQTAEWLRRYVPGQRSIDFRPSLTSASHVDSPMLVPHMVHRLPELYGVHSAYGYDPIYPDAYGDLMHRAGGRGRQSGSTRTVRMARLPENLLRRFGIRYVVGDPYERLLDAKYIELAAGQERVLNFEKPILIDRLWMRHLLSDGASLPQGALVGEVILKCKVFGETRLPVRAGVEVSNLFLDFPDGRAAHQPVDTARWWTVPKRGFRLPLRQSGFNWSLDDPAPLAVERITLRGLSDTATWTVVEMAVSVFDAHGYFHKVFESDGSEIYELRETSVPSPFIHRGPIIPPIDRETQPPEDVLVSAPFDVRVCLTEAAAAEHIVDPDSDPDEMVVTTKEWLPSRPSWWRRPYMRRSKLTIEAIERHADRLVFEVDARDPAVIRIHESWSPWWHARLDDGKYIETFRADLAQIGLSVPAGRHTVTLTYRPLPLYLAGSVSLIALLAILLLAFRHRLR